VKTPRPLVVLVSAGRLYTRPLRHRLRCRHRKYMNVRLGPAMVGGSRVALRPPRLSDWSRWRALRLRDQEYIEPYWASSPKLWADRHTERDWVEEYLRARQLARAGEALLLIIEVDGQLAGQIGIERIDRGAACGEVGVWLDSALSGRGVALTAAHLLGAYAFEELGLRRITAPVCVGNQSAAECAMQGMRREGTMVSYLDVGGRRQDHDLWAITSDMWASQTDSALPAAEPGRVQQDRLCG
jgi:RimJ/RimL family protein N-acetyltransferase